MKLNLILCRVHLFVVVTALAHIAPWRVDAATVVVTTATDEFDTPSGSNVSLREALRDARRDDTVTFAASLSGQTIRLKSPNLLPTLSVQRNVTVDASKLPDGLIISGDTNGNGVADEEDAQVLTILSGTVVLKGITIRGGYGPENGGGIVNSGRLTLDRCTLTGNSAIGDGGAIHNLAGTLTLDHCTLAGNSALGGNGNKGRGGGIFHLTGLVSLRHCTVAGNSADEGGGIYVDNGSSLELDHSIIAENKLTGGGSSSISNLGEIIFTDRNIVQPPILDVDGASTGPTPSDAAPRLAPLGNYGGPTPTMPPLKGSPAIDVGNTTGATTDQRGFTIVAKPDLGAVEVQTDARVNALSFNFVGSDPANGTLAANQPAGVPEFAFSSWNNLTNRSDPANTPLRDAEGKPVDFLRLWWQAPDNGQGGGATANPDQKLMHGFLKGPASDQDSTDLTKPDAQPYFGIADLPSAFVSAGYNVVVYFHGDRHDVNRVVKFWLTSNHGKNPGNVSGETNLTSYRFGRDSVAFTNTANYTPATGADANAATAGANYVVFTNLTAESFYLRTAAEGGAPDAQAFINAVQIVHNPVKFVTTFVDENSPVAEGGTGVSLREALRDAKPSETILFDPALSGKTIRLTNELSLSTSVTIDASTLPKGLIISGDRNGNNKVDSGDVRIFKVPNGVTVSLKGLTLQGGYQGTGACIENRGVLTLTRCTLRDNHASLSAGGIYNPQEGTLTLKHCTVANNSADGGNGGGILSLGPLALSHCTLAGNSATSEGGGINNGGPLTLAYTIVAGNKASKKGPDIFQYPGSVIHSGPSPNLIGVNESVANEFPAGKPNQNGDLVGNTNQPLNALLASLGDYGGPTPTMPPLLGSPALDAGPPTATETADQRGPQFPRVRGPKLDLGAVEDYRVRADSAWDVQEIILDHDLITSLGEAEELARNPGTNTVLRYQSQVINRHDPEAPGAGGLFDGDQPFAANNRTPTGKGRHGGNDDYFVLVAQCVIEIKQAGNYTFGFSGDDGARLKLYGAVFTSSVSLNPDNPVSPLPPGGTNTLIGPSVPGNLGTLGTCYLNEGRYGLEFLAWEGEGEAYCEVFAASGALNVMTTSFRLIGDTGSDGAVNGGRLTTPWDVVVLKDGASSLASATTQINNYWSDPALAINRGVKSFLESRPTVNFSDDSRFGGGGHGFTQAPFPGNSANAVDDNNFALGARTTLTVPAPGDYTFCLLSDDGASFRIKGSRGWTVSSPRATSSQPQALSDGMQANGCCADVFGTVHLEAREYEVELIYNEIASDAYVGLWSASGQHNEFNPSIFSLLGSDQRANSMLFSLSHSSASTPVNDDFARAFNLPGSVVHVAGSSVGATLEQGEPGGVSNSVWWNWTATVTGLVQVDTIGSAYSTVLAVLKGSGLAALVPVPTVGVGGNGTARLAFNANTGEVYHIQVGGKTNDNGLVSLNLEPILAPDNDDFVQAFRLDDEVSVSVFGNTLGATMEPFEAQLVPAPTNASVWFTWTAPYSANCRVDTTNSSFNTVVAIYTYNVGSLPQLAANAQKSVTFNATAGVTYHLVVAGASPDDQGDYFLNLNLDANPALASKFSAVKLSDDQTILTLEWDAEFQATYTVEESTDLVHWAPFRSNLDPTGPKASLLIPVAETTQPQRFFRFLRE